MSKLNLFNNRFWYDKMKPRQKKEIQEATYFNIMLNMLLSMFEWSGLPDTIPARYLDSMLVTSGQVAVGYDGDDLVCALTTLGGDPDQYGLGKEVIANTLNGHEIRGRRNEDVAWGVNNKGGNPDLLIYWIARQMSECDTSANMNVLYSRLLSIPMVKNDKQKTAIEEIYKKMIDGDFGSIISSNTLEGLQENDNYTIDLTDANKIDRIQYISRYFDDLLKRFCQFYGQPLQTQNKSAQTQIDELHGMDSFSFTLPVNMLKCRKELCENINRIFGTEIDVEFSECWKAEFTSFINRDTDGDGVPDLEESEGNVADEQPEGVEETIEDSEEVDQTETEATTEDDQTEPEASEDLTGSIDELKEAINDLSESMSEAIAELDDSLEGGESDV